MNIQILNRKIRFNHTKMRSKKIITLFLMLFILIFILTACNTSINDSNNNPKSYNKTDKLVESNEAKNVFEEDSSQTNDTIVEDTLRSDEPIDLGYSEVTLTMVGDMLLHTPVHESGKMLDGSMNFDHLFTNVKEKVSKYDIAIVNQEVILGGAELGLSGYPSFNGAYEVADALVNAGFNVILHATNHTLDLGKKGVLNCMNYWESNYPEIGILGINKSQEAQDNNIYVYEKDDIKIAILNYTYGTNGISLPTDMPYIVNLLDKDKIKQDVEKAKEIADFIVVAPHWGAEYTHTPSDQQVNLANFMADLGVDLVIGTHPHVVQPVEWIESENGNKMLIYYSIGNYVNSTESTGEGVTHRMVGAMAEVTIRKDRGEEPYISDYGATPLISHKDTSEPGLLTVYPAYDYSEKLASENEIINQDPSFSLELCLDIWNDVYPEFLQSIADAE